METLVLLAVGVFALGALVYWWLRPVTWQDAEGDLNVPRDPYGNRYGPMEDPLSPRVSLRGWWENERRRWRR